MAMELQTPRRLATPRAPARVRRRPASSPASLPRRALARIGLAALALYAPGAHALDAQSFGWRARDAVGTRPLLIIWVRQADDTPGSELARRRQYYEELLFGRLPHGAYPDAVRQLEPTLVGYYRDQSGGKFTFRRAGFVGPLNAPVKGKSAADIGRLAIVTAAREGHVDFRAFDKNHDGKISPNELAVLVIANVPNGQAHRYNPGMPIPGQRVSYASTDGVVGEGSGFGTMAHELFHGLGGIDLYGPWGQCYDLNRRLTLMAAIGEGGLADSEQIVNLDPWHKMRAGWIEPRLVVIGREGKAQLAAQHLALSAEPERKRPLLVYDEKKGKSEFFLLEYRTPYRLGYDKFVLTSGLVIWHIAYAGSGEPARLISERRNCKGSKVQVTAVFVRGAPDWQQGIGKAWSSANGEIPLWWMNHQDSGVRVKVAPHKWTEPVIEVTWTAPGAGQPAGKLEPGAKVGSRP
jgi:M6 family metalloprotease-like protein